MRVEKSTAKCGVLEVREPLEVRGNGGELEKVKYITLKVNI